MGSDRVERGPNTVEEMFDRADDYDLANELSLELAMVLPSAIYRAMVEAAAHPDGKVNPASVAVMMRREMLSLGEADLQPEQVAYHTPGVATKPRSKAH